jgi:putative transposase
MWLQKAIGICSGKGSDLKGFSEYKVNALALEKVIRRVHKVHIPHNRIHRVLKEHDKAFDEPAKKKRRKWVRYERKHSLSLVHTDWHGYSLGHN